MVQNDKQTIKEKIRQHESGSVSGSTVGSDVRTTVRRGPSGTSARPPPGIGIRLNDVIMQRKMELKGLVTDYKQCGYQGLTETEGRISSRTCTRLYLIHSKSMWIGSEPKQNREHGQQKQWSVCGSAMRPIYPR